MEKSFYLEAVYSTQTSVFSLDICECVQLVFSGEYFMMFHQQLVLSLISCAVWNCNTVDVLNKADSGSIRGGM